MYFPYCIVKSWFRLFLFLFLDSCDSESNTVETKGEDKDSLENCTSSTCEEIEHPSESVNVSGDLKLEPDDDDRISVEQQKEEKEVEVVLVPQESDVVVDNVQELITEGTEKQVKDSEELGDKGGNVVDEEENCEGEVSKRDEEADTTETGDEDGSLLQQALTSDLNQADGDIQLPLCQSELMQLATSIVGNLEDAGQFWISAVVWISNLVQLMVSCFHFQM